MTAQAPDPRRAIRWVYAQIALLAPISLVIVAIAVLAAFRASQADQLFLLVAAFAGVVAVRLESEIGGVSLSSDWVVSIIAVCVAPSLAPILGLCALASVQDHTRGRIFAMVIEVVTLQVAALVILSLPTTTTVPGAAGLAIVAVLTMAIVNALAYIPLLMARGGRPIAYFCMSARSAGAMMLLAIPLVVLALSIGESVQAWAIGLALGPVFVINAVHRQYMQTVEARDDIASKATLLARTNLQFAAAMVRALDHRDAYTAGHSAAVAVYTRDIAREMGFDEETVRVAHLAGLVHDIGKIGVPGRVLNKTAPLDDDEYEIMKSHAAMGAQILGEVDLYNEIALLVRYHHERIDGRGYPDGIEGEMIPAVSRMISVADTYSAMTTDRPYRDGMPTEKAMSILAEISGTQLDADFTEAFLRILARSDEGYQRGKQTDFEVEVAKHQAVSEVEAEAIRVSAPLVKPAEIDLDIEREAA